MNSSGSPPSNSSITMITQPLVPTANKPSSQISSTHCQLDLDSKETSRLLKKIDFALIPSFAILYLLSFLDRSNIGNARLAGLERDLKLTGLNYNVSLAVFFPFYIISEIPSNLILKRIRPSIWLPSIMLAWGLVCALNGFVTNFSTLLVVRSFLGLTEGGLFPGINFVITMWYKRDECGKRMAWFYSAGTAAGAFGGLFARAIIEMDGLASRSGWSWIFIIEGVLTIVIALLAFWVMQDYPDRAKFLTSLEKKQIQHRLSHDYNSVYQDSVSSSIIYDALLDWKVWVHAIITIGIYCTVYCYSLFLPTIVHSLGYANQTAQLMTVPPYLVACVFCIIIGYAADRHAQRGVYMILCLTIAITGLIMLLASQNLVVKYTGTFFLGAGLYPCVPQGIAWNGNNVSNPTKRSIAIALHVAVGNVGGIIACFLFPPSTAPRYLPGYFSLLAMLLLSSILCILMTVYLRWENARRDAIYPPLDNYSTAQQNLEHPLGNDASFFRYIV